MKVSIITAVYNGSATIEDCMKSIHFQTYVVVGLSGLLKYDKIVKRMVDAAATFVLNQVMQEY